MRKGHISNKKTNTAKHTANRNFCKKSLCKRNNDERLPQVKNGKLSYFKIDFLFIICLALGIALTTCGERFPSNDHHDNDRHDNDRHDNDHNDNDHNDNDHNDNDHNDNDCHDNDHNDNDCHDNDSADRDFSPLSIQYMLKTGELAKFVSKWHTDSTIALPLVENGRYDFIVDWGDGSTDSIASWDATEKTHIYAQPDTYTVTITGTIVGWAFSRANANTLKLTAVSQWGNLHLGNTAGYQFYGARNLDITASDAPFLHDGDETYTTDLSYAFAEATRLRGNLNNWDVSHVENMQGMFWNANAFNQPISDWVVASATNMSRMFFFANAFNQPLGGWNDHVGKVTNMNAMFFYAEAFNQPIGDWKVGNVTNMEAMFSGANAFNHPLGGWNDRVGKVTNMREMFSEALDFNQPIGNWNVANVIYCSGFADNSTLAASNMPTFQNCNSQ